MAKRMTEVVVKKGVGHWLDVTVDEEFIPAIKEIGGVTGVTPFFCSSSEYTVWVDGRYPREDVQAEIEALVERGRVVLTYKAWLGHLWFEVTGMDKRFVPDIRKIDGVYGVYSCTPGEFTIWLKDRHWADRVRAEIEALVREPQVESDPSTRELAEILGTKAGREHDVLCTVKCLLEAAKKAHDDGVGYQAVLMALGRDIARWTKTPCTEEPTSSELAKMLGVAAARERRVINATTQMLEEAERVYDHDKEFYEELLEIVIKDIQSRLKNQGWPSR